MPAAPAPSLYHYVREHISDERSLFRAPKATLIDISHALEDALLPDHKTALLFAGFQRGTFWKQEQRRYDDLAAGIGTVVVFAQGTPTINGDRHLHVALAPGDPLCREWFVLTLTGGYAALLSAIEVDEPGISPQRRSFDAVYTFDQTLIAGCIDLLARVVEGYQPGYAVRLREAMGRLPAAAPDGAALSRLMALMMGYSRDRQERLQEAVDQQRELRAAQRALEQTLVEVAVPVIPLVPGVLVMPLVGAIDARRSQQVMETLLSGIADNQADVAILDITGVPVVDTNVANNLIMAVRAANMLGAEVILTGIGADIAQTLVHLEVDFSRIQTCADLQSGIQAALALQGLRIGRSSDDRR